MLHSSLAKDTGPTASIAKPQLIPLIFGVFVTLALFDLDNTLLGGDSDHAWGMF